MRSFVLAFITTMIGGFALFYCLTSPAEADQTVYDSTGLMSNDVISQIDARNQKLESATRIIVAVVIVHGTNGETEDTASDTADRFAKDKYAAIVWVATDTEQTRIIFVNQGVRWLSDEERSGLGQDLSKNMRFCCPGETVPGIVDKIATALEAAAQRPVTGRSYIRDELGLLSDTQQSQIAARIKKLEMATGKGVAVVTLAAQPGTQAGIVAYKSALELNVKGDVVAVVWVARDASTITYHMMPDPFAKQARVTDAQEQDINAKFDADMHAGSYADAIVAVVDRTATAIEAIAANTAQAGATASPGVAESPLAEATETPAPQPRNTNAVAWFFFFVLLIIVFAVIAAARRSRLR